MQYRSDLSKNPTQSPKISQSLPHRSTVLNVTQHALDSIRFFNVLRELPWIDSLDRQELTVKARQTIDSKNWQTQLPESGFAAAKVEEFVIQKLSRQFFITNRFSAFASGKLPFITPRRSPLEDRIADLDDSQLTLLARVAEYCPVSAGMAAAYLAEDIIPANNKNPFHGIAVRQALEHRESLKTAIEALAAVDAFLAELIDRPVKALTTDSQAIVDAWRKDLALPIIESVIFSVAAGITPMEKGYDAGASWYVNRVSLPADSSEAKNIYSNWRDVSRSEPVLARAVLYEGIDLEYKGEKHRVLKDGKIPVPLLVGAHDPVKLFTWYRDVFTALRGCIDPSASIRSERFKTGCLARFEDGAQMLLRGRADSHGQPRIGITTAREYGQISIRLDLEERTLALDFGALSPSDMFAREKDLLRLNRGEIERYNELRQTIAHSENRDHATQRKEVEARERLILAAKKISHFSPQSERAVKEIPSFIAAMSGVGRSLGIRSSGSIGHHALESLYRLSQSEPRIDKHFEELISKLSAGLLASARW